MAYTRRDEQEVALDLLLCKKLENMWPLPHQDKLLSQIQRYLQQWGDHVKTSDVAHVMSQIEHYKYVRGVHDWHVWEISKRQPYLPE